MDIRQLKYFIEIVNCNFNLSTASDKLCISQPALSMGINKFEKNERTELFVRSKRLIVGLTSVGETFYYNALKVVEQYDSMIEQLRRQSATINGRMRIGIPPFIVTVLCNEFLNTLIRKYHLAEYIIDESGAYDLKKKLLLNEIDSAILLKPSELNPDLFNEVLLNQDELSAFMSKNHRLAKKDKLNWSDLEGEDLVIFDNTYMIHHKLINKFHSLDISVHIVMMSKSWDFLIESVKDSEYITILPSPTSNYYNISDITEVKFEDPLPWEAIYVYPKKARYSRIEDQTHHELIEYYSQRRKKGNNK